jgi:hypothetical protein
MMKRKEEKKRRKEEKTVIPRGDSPRDLLFV